MINKAIFNKTLSRFLKIKNILIYTLVLALPLFLFAQIASKADFFAVTSLNLKAEYIFGFFSVFAFVWILGVALAILSTVFCSSLIAEEVSNRTILLLVTKPVKRFEIFISKFLAFMLSISIYSALSLFVSVYIWASAFKLDIMSLSLFFGKLPLFFIYSLFVSLFFGSITAAISTISSSKLKSILPVVLIIILTFFGFIQIRGVSRSMGVYTGVLSFVDVGYDFGNIYISLIEKGGTKFIPFMQSIIGTFTGTYEIPENGVNIDYDHGFILESLDRLCFRSPLQSFIKLTIFPIVLILFGLILFNRRDIS